ncbi:MAG TPA: HlyD family secretion protein [Terriglobales bacterium]|nr:HlyD family secretion protein [Terriglobales bacterium]
MTAGPGRPALETESDRAAAGPETGRGPSPARRIAWIVLLAIVALGAGVLVRHLLWARGHVSDDNAQVEGHIIPVLSRVSGYVSAVLVDDDQQVRAGQVLVRIDDRDLAARLAQAEGDLATALAMGGSRGETGQAAAQLQAARAAVAQAEANARKAESDRDRYRTLAQRNIVSRQQLDAAEAAAEAAEAQLRAALEQVTAASAGVRGAQSRVEAARAARDQAALQLSYATIAAPEAGVVTRKSVEVGQYVQAGQPLMSVVPLHDVWVVANLKETEVRNVLPGDSVRITVDSYPGRVFHGHVESMSPATGAKFSLLPPDNATGNFTKVVQRIPTRVRLDEPNDPVRPLRPGMSVRVVIATKK